MSGPDSTGPAGADPSRRPARGASGRVIEVLLTVGALVVFAFTWIYVAAAIFSDGTLLADTWAWLSGLQAIAAFLIWLALLPLVVFLWAWQADLEPWVMGLVMLGLVAWTLMALSGLWRRGRAAAA
jgi:hypothetical protein